MRNFLNLVLAFIILVGFGGVAFFLWNISAKAKFSRIDSRPPAESE